MNAKRILTLAVLAVLTAIYPVYAAPNDLDKDLYFAALSQELPAVQGLLAKGANPNYLEQGRPVLGWVAQAGNVDIVKALLKGGANPNLADEGIGHTPLMRAIDMQFPEIVKVLLEAKADPNAVAKDGKTCLLMAIGSQKPEILQALIDAGADVKKKLPEDNSLVLETVQFGGETAVDMIKILAKAGAELNLSNAAYTPLVYALNQENAKLTQALLDAGADPNAPTSSGKLPIQEVLSNADLLGRLLKAKADPNKELEYDGSPLLQAIRDGNADVVKVLLENGADPRKAGKDGVAPLQLAEQYGQTEIKALIEKQVGGGVAAAEQPKTYAIEAVTSGGTTCTIVDAAKKQMEIHALLQAQVDAGKMDSNIFRTFNDDTVDYGKLLTENPAEACNLLERLRKKYGV